MIKPGEAIILINQYKDLIKTQRKKVIAYVAKQGEILKKLKDLENFFENAEQSWSTVYYKIGLYKFLQKHPKLKNSMLPSIHFRNNFKSIKSVCKQYPTLFLWSDK